MNTMKWGIILGIGFLPGMSLAKGKTLVVGLPIISMSGEATSKIEYNLSGPGAVGIEVTTVTDSELYSEREIEENQGDSILSNGIGVVLTYSSYSNEMDLSGGYWALGIGYRSLKTKWNRSPSEDFSPAGVSLDDDGRFSHSLRSEGLQGMVG